jgi:hypothetical protein
MEKLSGIYVALIFALRFLLDILAVRSLVGLDILELWAAASKISNHQGLTGFRLIQNTTSRNRLGIDETKPMKTYENDFEIENASGERFSRLDFGLGYRADSERAGRLDSTNAFEIEGDVVKAIYVVRNPDKLSHLASL